LKQIGNSEYYRMGLTLRYYLYYTISVLYVTYRECISSNPDMIKQEVLKQLGLPEPIDIRIGWGAEWNGKSWDFSQSSGVLSLYGQLPFFGKCPTVAMCGMMSPRNTPYSSIEAAIEVSRSLSHEIFGSRKPLKPLPLSRFLLYTVLLLILIVLVLVYRR